MYADVGEIVVSGDCIEWTIKDFKNRPYRINDMVNSASFSYQGKLFSLNLHPKGWTSVDSAGWLGCSLLPKTSGQWSEYKAEFSLRKKDGKNTKNKDANYCGMYFIILRFIRTEALVVNREDLLPDGNLTILCYLRQVTSPFHEDVTAFHQVALPCREIALPFRQSQVALSFYRRTYDDEAESHSSKYNSAHFKMLFLMSHFTFRDARLKMHYINLTTRFLFHRFNNRFMGNGNWSKTSDE